MRGLETNGKAIRQLRKSKGLTQKKLAEAAGCVTRTIRNAERGSRIDGATLANIAEACGVEITQISCNSDEPNPQIALHLDVVRQWHLFFAAQDLEALLQLHHPEASIEIPGTEGMPGGGTFRGIDEVRNHFVTVFALFQLVKDHEHRFDAVDNLVFERTVATFRGVQTGQYTTGKFYHEFEFQEGLIFRRLTIADMSPVARLLGLD